MQFRGSVQIQFKKTGFKCNDAAAENMREQNYTGGLTSAYSMEGDEGQKQRKSKENHDTKCRGKINR